MNALILALPGNEALGLSLAKALDATLGELILHTFPDGETYVRIAERIAGREVILVCTLDSPNEKFLPLAFTAATVKQLGAARVGLIAPYLAYMRQDKRFKSGEGITSEYFAHLISSTVDWLITVDPHLHRYHALTDIYTIPHQTLHAAPLVAEWIRTHINTPLIIGPDAESAQWVAAVATAAHAPFIVLEKTRHGDHEVTISAPQLARWQTHTPVLVDDIISTGHTLMKTIQHLTHAGMHAPVCVGVHALMAGRAYDDLLDAGAVTVVTCNTIAHISNHITVTALLARAVRELMPPLA